MQAVTNQPVSQSVGRLTHSLTLAAAAGSRTRGEVLIFTTDE
jgi:hypothetical protein